MSKEKILLALLPFWVPLIPPMGISCLKAFLQRRGYEVKTADANVEGQFREIYDRYLETLKGIVPLDRQGNFYNIANDVLRNHLVLHVVNMDPKAEGEYARLVEPLILENFFCPVGGREVDRLKEILEDFFYRLESYLFGLLEKENPTLLGLSVFNGTLASSLFAFKRAKERYPHMKTVMGGGIFAGELAPTSPALQKLLEKAPYIDKVIIGEGEILFLKYLRGELPAAQRVYSLEDINGEVLDISSADIPVFRDFNLRHYPYMTAYTSRGCPFRCSFCSETVCWGTYRKKKGKLMVSQLKSLYEAHGSQLFLMSDSLLNPVIKDLSLELLREDFSLYWDGYLRADSAVVDIENTLLWRRAGFYRARLGLESGSPRVLEAMGKHITPAQIREAVSSLAYAGIKTTTYWVIGHPGETETDFQHTLDLVETLTDDIYEADCNPFNYYYTGQVNSRGWHKQGKQVPLYPGETQELLLDQTWVLRGEPSREETYDRVRRFTAHCRKLGIPNPYSLQDIYAADERWQKLHKNAVPPVIQLERGTYVVENKKVKKLVRAESPQRDDDGWEW